MWRARRSSSTAATPSASIWARRFDDPPPPPIVSWPSCPAIRAGSGPWWWRRIPARTTPRSAKWCWCRGRRRCWRRSGCPGTSGCSPVTSAPATCSPRRPRTTRLVPGFAATGDPAIDDVAYELGLGRRRLLSQLGRARRRPALARRRLRSRVGDGPVDPAGVPGLRLLSAAVRGARADVRRLRQRVVGGRPRRRRRIRVRRALGHACARGCRLTARTTPSTTASSKSSSRRHPPPTSHPPTSDPPTSRNHRTPTSNPPTSNRSPRPSSRAATTRVISLRRDRPGAAVS